MCEILSIGWIKLPAIATLGVFLIHRCKSSLLWYFLLHNRSYLTNKSLYMWGRKRKKSKQWVAMGPTLFQPLRMHKSDNGWIEYVDSKIGRFYQCMLWLPYCLTTSPPHYQLECDETGKHWDNREVADSRTPGIFMRDTACFHFYSMNCDS